MATHPHLTPVRRGRAAAAKAQHAPAPAAAPVTAAVVAVCLQLPHSMPPYPVLLIFSLQNIGAHSLLVCVLRGCCPCRGVVPPASATHWPCSNISSHSGRHGSQHHFWTPLLCCVAPPGSLSCSEVGVFVSAACVRQTGSFWSCSNPQGVASHAPLRGLLPQKGSRG